MKTNDITVCAFPRSGITYLGFLLTTARLLHNRIDLRPTFYNIDWLLIDTHKMSGCATASIWKDGLGDLYKTHSKWGVQAVPPNVIYLLRNPVDTLASYFHFLQRVEHLNASMEQFLNSSVGIQGWIDHVKSWLIDNHNASQSLYLLDYEKLLNDPEEELWQLWCQLGLPVSGRHVNEAAVYSRIEHMRELERTFVESNPVYAHVNLEFVRPLRGGNSEEPCRFVEEMTLECIELIQHRTRDIYNAARGVA
jgi:Sulfotransferase domain